jgi:DNA-directed RNA polymerase subunit M/transcription elongation factor TFIIS
MPIASFNESAPAEKLATRLREAGFQAEVRDESQEQKWKLYNLHPKAHIRVVINETQAQEAEGMMRKWDQTDGALAAAIRCPECGSARIEYPQFSRRTIMGAFPAALAAAGVIERDFYCEACQYTWPEHETPIPEQDALWWSKGKPVIKGLD